MDASLFRWTNRLAERTPWAHGVVAGYAKYGIVVFALMLAGACLQARRRGDLRALAGTAWTAGSSLIALAIGQVVGGAVDRARPYDAMSGVHVLIARTTDFSFPSDHATVAGAVTVGLLLAHRRWGVVAIVAAVLMAFARVYAGVHYPSDVAGGLALGALVAGAGQVAVVPVVTRIARRLSHTRLRLVLTRAAVSADEG